MKDEHRHRSKHRHRSSDSDASSDRRSRKSRDKRKKEKKHKKDKKSKDHKKRGSDDSRKPRHSAPADPNEPLGSKKDPQDDYMGYTNEDNPFGDAKLCETFVWQAKLRNEGRADLCYEEVQELQRRKMRESTAELMAVRKRRLQREREREERESMIEQEQREKEAVYYREWEKQEDSFHLQQAKQRSRIRITEGRAKPIDLLARYISAAEDIEEEGALDMHEPHQFLQGLSIEDLEDLLEDIKVYIELEQGKNVEYWQDITIVVEDELEKLRRLKSSASGGSSVGVGDRRGDRRASINPSVLANIEEIIRGKTHNQLVMLEQKVRQTLEKPREDVDITFWETLQQHLKVYMARSRLRERHEEILRGKLERLKQEQGIVSQPLFPSGMPSSSDHRAMPPPEAIPSTSKMRPPELDAEETSAAKKESEPSDEEDVKDSSDEDEREAYDSGRYSPRLLSFDSMDMGEVLYEPEDDRKKLEFHRSQVLSQGRMSGDAEDELVRQAREGMAGDEAQFSVQVPLENQSFLWSDKYRPRKPRFFNRVHTGFEWNKYNQTHYDLDNPPPKIVQGYKFNIFYPDLIDKTTTPSYTITDDENDRDFAILRFKAGPPYEDIAFRIVKRDWELSYKRSFRCQFHNNVFQLWFHFKRYRYRR